MNNETKEYRKVGDGEESGQVSAGVRDAMRFRFILLTSNALFLRVAGDLTREGWERDR